MNSIQCLFPTSPAYAILTPTSCGGGRGGDIKAEEWVRTSSDVVILLLLQVLGIWIHRIRIFWASRIRIPHPDPLVTSMDPALDPAPDPSIIKQNLDFSCFVASLWLCTSIFIRRIRMFFGIPDPHPDLLVIGTNPRTGSASRSIPKCHGSQKLLLL